MGRFGDSTGNVRDREWHFIFLKNRFRRCSTASFRYLFSKTKSGDRESFRRKETVCSPKNRLNTTWDTPMISPFTRVTKTAGVFLGPPFSCIAVLVNWESMKGFLLFWSRKASISDSTLASSIGLVIMVVVKRMDYHAKT